MHIFCPEIPRRRFLPARLLDSWNETVASQVAEADAADPKLAIHGPRPATNLATAVDANPFARQHLDLVGRSQTGLQLFHLSAELDVLCFGCHRSNPTPIMSACKPSRVCPWKPDLPAANKKADVVEYLRYSSTSAYSSTSPPVQPGCPSSSHPTTSNKQFGGVSLALPPTDNSTPSDRKSNSVCCTSRHYAPPSAWEANGVLPPFRESTIALLKMNKLMVEVVVGCNVATSSQPSPPRWFSCLSGWPVLIFVLNKPGASYSTVLYSHLMVGSPASEWVKVSGTRH